jgi:hypothetical protein
MELQVGNWRPSATSLQVRPCPDAHMGCTQTWTCNGSTSGCRGGVDVATYCAPGLEGPFCQLCSTASTATLSHSERVYYVHASRDEIAHCAPCGTLVTKAFGIFFLVVGLLAAALVSILVSRPYWPPKYDQMAKRYWRAAKPETLVKILVRLPRLTQATHSPPWHGCALLTVACARCAAQVGFYLILVKVDDVYEVTLPPEVSTVIRDVEYDTTPRPTRPPTRRPKRPPISCHPPLAPAPTACSLPPPPSRCRRFVVYLNLGSVTSVLQCVGMHGYHVRLLMWMLVPPALLLLICLVALGRLTLGKTFTCAALKVELWDCVLPLTVRVFFFLYPLIANVAFEAFSCCMS